MWSWALLLSSSARKKRRRGERWTKGAEREMPYACTHWKQMAKWLSRPPVLFSFLAAQWFLFISYFIAFLPYTLKDVICVKYCYLHFLLHSSFTLQVFHFSFSCSLFLSRPYLQSDPLNPTVIRNSCCAAKHCSHSQSFIWNSSGDLKVSKDTTFVRLSVASMH